MALKKSFAATAILLICIVMHRGESRAAQVNFPVIPPPVAYPYFGDGDVDVKFRFNAGRFRGDEVSASSTGGDFVHRFALNDRLSLAYQAGLNYTRGKSGSGTGESEIFFKEIPLGLNCELMALRGSLFRTLLFAGAGYSYLTGKGTGITAAGRTVKTSEMAMKGNLQGGQAGIMAGLYRGELDLSLIAAYSYRRGSFTMKEGSADFGGDIAPYQTWSLGLDISYRGMTIGYLRQMAGASGESRKYAADIVSLSAYMNF